MALDGAAQPVLLGAGLRPGSERGDLQALSAMWAAWCPDGPLLDLSSAAAAAEGLRVWLSVSGDPATPALPGQVRGARRAPLPGADPVVLRWSLEGGPVDEIGVDLGPDLAHGGLLDPLTWSGVTGEATNELTGAIENTDNSNLDEDTRIKAPKSALLARMLQAVQQPPSPERFSAREGRPAEAVLRLVLSEPLDVLPTPDGQLTALSGWEENTATQVHLADLPPAEDTAPSVPAPEPARSGGEISMGTLIVAIIVALFAGAAAVWWLLDQLSGM